MSLDRGGCHDGQSISSSLDALPKHKRAALERRVSQSPQALLGQMTLLLSLQLVLPLLGLGLTIVGVVWLLLALTRDAPLLRPLLVSSLGSLLVLGGKLVDRRLTAIIGPDTSTQRPG